MSANGVRIWFDYVLKCSERTNNNAPCVSDCNNLNSLGNLTHTQTRGNSYSDTYSNTQNLYYFSSLNTVSNIASKIINSTTII